MTDAARALAAEALLFCRRHLIEVGGDYNAGSVIRKIDEALAALSAGDGWAPIESAPKGDGEEGPDILLFGPVHPHSGYKRPFYIENSRWYRTAWTITFMDGHGQPTHWQPLPSAPMEDKP